VHVAWRAFVERLIAEYGGGNSDGAEQQHVADRLTEALRVPRWRRR
jgi:hypothetical protein